MKDQQSNLIIHHQPVTVSILQHTLDSVIVVVFTLNPLGQLLYVNKPCMEVWGYTPEELCEKNILDLVAEEDHQRTQQYLKALMSGHSIMHFENHFQRKDGTIVPISWASRWAATEGLLYCTVRDITERRQLVEVKERYKSELQKQHQQMVDMLERITDGFFAIDHNWTITFANCRANDILGMSKEYLTGKNFWGIFPNARGTVFETSLSRALYEQVPVHFTTRSYTLPIEVEISAYPSENGMTLFYRDVTKQKQLQQVLEEEKEKRQQLINAATIAAQEHERAHVGRELHDNVNQVLTSVKLYQELCLNDEANREALTRRSIKLLQDTINEIRSLSKRLSAPLLGNIKLSESVKELVETVSATNQLEIQLDTSGIEEMEVAQDLHLAVYRILQEHLTNILKHAGAKQVTITLDTTGGALTVLITDDGRGFDTRQQCSGIGLLNMQTRAESMNGTLDIQSQPGKGCILLVQFPLAQKH